MAAEYDGSVEQVHRAFGDEQYWLARLTDSGADDYSLDSMTVDERRHRRRHHPDAARRPVARRGDAVPPRRPELRARGDLDAGRDGQATATVKGSITGAPATLTGTAVLAPAKSGAGSRLEFKATVEVNIPLVGGKIENFIGSQLVDLLIAEQRFTTVWITENT